MSEPDFYLASTEGYELENPRRCWRIKRPATDNRDDLLHIKIEPPLIGQQYGLGGRDIGLVLIATRHQGRSLFPINEWPLCVQLAWLLIEHPEDRDVLREDEFESIGWAELYRTEEDVRLKVM